MRRRRDPSALRDSSTRNSRRALRAESSSGSPSWDPVAHHCRAELSMTRQLAGELAHLLQHRGYVVGQHEDKVVVFHGGHGVIERFSLVVNHVDSVFAHSAIAETLRDESRDLPRRASPAILVIVHYHAIEHGSQAADGQEVLVTTVAGGSNDADAMIRIQPGDELEEPGDRCRIVRVIDKHPALPYAHKIETPRGK